LASSRVDPLRLQGFTDWIAPHWGAMIGLATRLAGPHSAEDVVQEALLLAWRKWSSFDASRGSPRAWLLSLTADQTRRARRRVKVTVRLTAAEEPRAVDCYGSDSDLLDALNRLSARQRLAIELYYYIGLPISEVAEAMKCSEGTVKSTLHDSREKLRRLLEVPR
jgi:RNA polymerase sigma-70 factor (ECF subfamily)